LILFLAVATAVLWGFAAIFDHAASQKEDAVVLGFWERVIELAAIPAALAINSGQVLRVPSLGFVIYAGMSGAVWFLAWQTYMLALRREPTASAPVALVSAYPLISLVVLVLFFSQSLKLTIWMGTVAICAGGFLLQRMEREDSASSTGLITLSAISALFWGLWAVFAWRAVQYGSPIELLGVSPIFGVGFALIVGMARVARGGRLRLAKPARLPIVAAGLLYAAADLCWYFALGHGSPGYVIAISAAYPLITLVANWSRGAESITASRFVAIATLVAGVALVQQ
jgi:drug/metabolite transporter (DMT)-like permease